VKDIGYRTQGTLPVSHLLFAADGDSAFVSFCHQWADVATIVGLLITLGGFIWTLIQLWRIKSVVRGTVKRVALQIAATELGTILRLSTGVREADSQGQRELALYQCREASFAAQALSHNSHLAHDQRNTLREVAQDLHLIVQHMLRGRQQGATLNPLSDYQAGRLERTISKLSDMNGRLRSSALEV
jgi:hypothetical protein